MTKKVNIKLTLFLLVAMLSWGLSWTNAKIIGSYADASLILFWRFMFATISFLFMMILNRHPFHISKTRVYLILLNSIFMVSYNYFYFKATQIGLAGKGGVLVTTLNPIITTVISGVFFGGIIRGKDYLGLLLGLISGGIILNIWSSNFLELYNSGNIFFLGASICWAFVTITTAKSKTKVPFMAYTFWSFSTATALSLPLALGNGFISVFYFDWMFWTNLLILSVIAMSFGTSIYFLASIELGPKRASAFIFTVPLSAMLFSAYFLSENIEISTIAGGFIGMIAVYIINK